uniref:Uncharacterized protein n=1 Tax=Megaselia scalaris TaxID=36166 RepID=T1GYG0_MEGSC
MWNSLISGILIMTCYIGLNQASVQRIVSLPSLKDARKAMIIFVFGFIITNFTVDFLGVIIASYFHECDPLKAGYIKTPDNMVSYFVTKTSSNIRGMYGIYMACIVCASLSTISANLNSLSGALFKDYIKSMIPTQRNENFIIKIIVFLSGCFLIFGGLILESLKSTAVQLSYTVFNLAYTSFISTFMLGFLAPRMRAKPMFIANIVGFLIMLAIILNGQYQYISGQFEYRPLEKNVQGCSLNVTIVDHHKPYPNKFDLFKMSYHWYVVLGSIITWTIAEVLNVVLSKEEIEEVDPKLFAPWIREKIIEARRDCENEMEEIVPLK